MGWNESSCDLPLPRGQRALPRRGNGWDGRSGVIKHHAQGKTELHSRCEEEGRDVSQRKGFHRNPNPRVSKRQDRMVEDQAPCLVVSIDRRRHHQDVRPVMVARRLHPAGLGRARQRLVRPGAVLADGIGPQGDGGLRPLGEPGSDAGFQSLRTEQVRQKLGAYAGGHEAWRLGWGRAGGVGLNERSGLILEHPEPALWAVTEPSTAGVPGAAPWTHHARVADSKHGERNKPEQQQADMKVEGIAPSEPLYAQSDQRSEG